MNRCDVGSDGKTPLQRLHGQRDNTPILEFEEKDPVHAGQASERGKVGTAIPSQSVCWHAELIVRGSGCHRAGDLAIKTRSANIRRVPESERWDAGQDTRRCEPLRGPRMAVTMRSTSQVGMERPAEMMPRDPGEVLMENKVAVTYLRRADFERWGLSEGCPWVPVSENWPGTPTGSHRSMP